MMHGFPIAGVAALAPGVLTWIATEDPTLRTAGWAATVILLGLRFAFRAGHRFDIFSPAFFVGMTAAITYGAAAYLPLFGDFKPTAGVAAFSALDKYPDATAAVALALLGFVLGYKQVWQACGMRGSELLRFNTTPGAEWRLALAMAIIGYAALGAAAAQNLFFQGTVEDRDLLLVGIVGFAFEFVYVGLVLALANALETRERRWRLLALFSLVAVVASGTASGSKTGTLIGFIFVFFAWNYVRTRTGPLQAVMLTAVLCGVLAVLFPANILYRTAVQEAIQESQEGAHSTTVRALELAGDAYADLGEAEFMELGYGYLGSRLSNVDVVANVLRRQSEGLPLAWGETYARVVPAFVPRIVWPDKPSISLSNEFAVSLGYASADAFVLGEATSFTALGITMVGELVYNFPIWLVPLFAVLIGLLYRSVYETFLVGYLHARTLAVAIYGSWWYGIIFASYESNFAGYMAGTIKATIAMLALFWLFGIQAGKRHQGAGLPAVQTDSRLR